MYIIYVKIEAHPSLSIGLAACVAQSLGRVVGSGLTLGVLCLVQGLGFLVSGMSLNPKTTNLNP